MNVMLSGPIFVIREHFVVAFKVACHSERVFKAFGDRVVFAVVEKGFLEAGHSLFDEFGGGRGREE